MEVFILVFSQERVVCAWDDESKCSAVALDRKVAHNLTFHMSIISTSGTLYSLNVQQQQVTQKESDITNSVLLKSSVANAVELASLKPRLHQRNVLRGNKLRGRATCCLLQHVASCAQHVALV